jgi:glycosyltransferase involved in cell wall biosynthesis
MPGTIFSLLDTPAYGGAEEYLLQVLFHLQAQGNRVVLATNNASVKKRAGSTLEIIHLPYRLDAIGNWKGLIKYFIALPGALVWLVTTLKTLASSLYPLHPVVCIFPGYTDRLSFSPFVKILGCRLIWLEYGPLEPTFVRNFGFPRLLYAIGRPFPDVVVTISEWTKRSLMALGKIPQEKIIVIYPGVVIPPRRDPNKKNSTLTVSTVARLASEKEIDVLLRAWAKIDRSDKKLQIIGDGPERDALEQLAKDLGIRDIVTFTGFVSEVEKRRLLSHSDLFVFPSAWPLEGFGMTTIEAMALGIPVVSSGFGPQAEIVKDGKTGWVFKPHDADDLARVITMALRSSQRLVMGARGKEQVSIKFNTKQMLRSWDTVI